MRKIFCDRCGEEITENPVKAVFEEIDRLTGDFAEKGLHTDLAAIDLCKNCTDHIADKIRLFCHRCPTIINQDFEDAVQEMIATSQSKNGECDPPPVVKEKRRLDCGKIRALKNAGWTVKAIAEEMNCSEQAVYNVLKKLAADKKKAPEPGQQEGQSKTN